MSLASVQMGYYPTMPLQIKWRKMILGLQFACCFLRDRLSFQRNWAVPGRRGRPVSSSHIPFTQNTQARALHAGPPLPTGGHVENYGQCGHLLRFASPIHIHIQVGIFMLTIRFNLIKDFICLWLIIKFHWYQYLFCLWNISMTLRQMNYIMKLSLRHAGK